MKKFKISFLQQFLLLFHLIAINTAVLVGFYYFFGTIFPNRLFLFVYAFMFLFNILPTIFLHIQYYLKNKDAILVINSELGTLSYSQSNSSLQYSFNEIRRIVATASYGKGTGYYSFSEYRYCKIIFNDNSKIIITCLMVNDIDNTLEKLLKKEVEKTFTLLAAIGKSSVNRIQSKKETMNNKGYNY